MKIATTMSTIFATAVSAGIVGIASASTASADQATNAGTLGLGSQRTLVNGDVVQGWTISELKPSTDAIPYPVQGTLWEAIASDEAIKGDVIPIVPNLGARAPSGQLYRALYQVATPQGVNPATLAQGQTTTGKVYFDVTADTPNVVVYNAGGQDLASWVPSEPLRSGSGTGTTTGSVGRPVTTPAAATALAPKGVQQIPTDGAGVPAPTRSQAARTSGSQGTPIPANSPVPPEISPAPLAPGVNPAPPAPEISPAPQAPEVSPAPPTPPGSQGAPAANPTPPAPEASPAPPTPPGSQGAPAANQTSPAQGSPAAPAPAGSQGFPGSPATAAP